jgi:hypothetical protein
MMAPLAPLRLGLPPGEPSAQGFTAVPALVSLPLQLSLMGSAFPAMSGLMGEDCQAAAEASGNTIGGFSVQHAAYLPLTPRLTLHGFSQLGCALDSRAGGGATYLLPLDENLALVGSGGFSIQPSLPSAARIKADARVDLLMDRSAAHPFAIGVDLGRKGFSLTSAW